MSLHTKMGDCESSIFNTNLKQKTYTPDNKVLSKRNKNNEDFTNLRDGVNLMKMLPIIII